MLWLILLGGWLLYVVHQAEQKKLNKKPNEELSELFATLKYLLLKTFEVIGFLLLVLIGIIGAIGAFIVWLFFELSKVFKILWQKFTDFCYPNREIFEEIDKIKAIAQNFETYRKEKLENIDAQRRTKIFQINEVALEAETEEIFNNQQLTEFDRELTQLVVYMEWQILSQTSQSHPCPHCSRKILVTKKAANKVVKCPYCRGRIKVTK